MNKIENIENITIADDTYHSRYAPDRKHNKGDKKFKPLKKVCSKCGTTKGQLDINHKDGNRKNNNRSNLQYMCRSCHRKMHAKKNGGKGSLESNIVISTAARIIQNPKSENSEAIANKHQNSDIMYVEFILCHADANDNQDRFTSEDMSQSYKTIINKPLNWEHKSKYNIGTHFDSKFVSIAELSEEEKAYYGEIDPLKYDFIVVQAAIWEYKFPEEARIMREREAEKTLTFSMENYFEFAKCSTCGEEWAIGRAFDYCDHMLTRRQDKKTDRIFINSNFVGSATTKTPADKDSKSLALAAIKSKKSIFSGILSCKVLSQMDIEKEIIPYIVKAGSNCMKINKLETIPKDFQHEVELHAEAFADETNKLFPIDCPENVVLSAEIALSHEDMRVYSFSEKLHIIEKIAIAANEYDINLGDHFEVEDRGENPMIDTNSPEFKQAVSVAIAEQLKKIEDGTKVAELETTLAEANTSVATVTKELETSKEELKAKAAEFDEFKLNLSKKEQAEARWNTLVEKGFTFEKTADRVKNAIAEMDDDQFNSYVEVLAEAVFKKKEDKPSEEKELSDEEKKKLEDDKKKKEKAKASVDPVEESNKTAIANKSDDGAASASAETASDMIFKEVLGL